MVKFIKLHKNAGLPSRGTANSTGIDLRYCADDPDTRMVLPHGKQVIVPTGLAVRFPEGYFGQIVARSGLAAKNGITVLCGTIDPDYSGELKVVMCNVGDTDHYFSIKAGDRIAQLLILPHKTFPIQWADEAELPEGQRGAGGFGSTGTS